MLRPASHGVIGFLLFGAALTVGGWALQRAGESQLGQQAWLPRPAGAVTGDAGPGR